LEKNISILAKATQVSDVAHGPLVFDCNARKKKTFFEIDPPMLGAQGL
jgi:hypothetical protein